MYMVSISSETTVISASLSQVQSLLLRQTDLPAMLESRPELVATLDAALTGCMVLFSCLDDEMQNILASSSKAGLISWRSKAKMVWNQDRLKELLDALRGLQSSMNVLLSLLQVDSLAEIKRLIEEGRPSLAQAVQKTQSLRYSHPRVNVSASIYWNGERDDGIETEDYPGSIWSDREFDFDDMIVNSRAYRRALAAARTRKQSTIQAMNPPQERSPTEGTVIDLSSFASEETKPPRKTPYDLIQAGSVDIREHGQCHMPAITLLTARFQETAWRILRGGEPTS
jgi:hypothetical protein